MDHMFEVIYYSPNYLIERMLSKHSKFYMYFDIVLHKVRNDKILKAPWYRKLVSLSLKISSNKSYNHEVDLDNSRKWLVMGKIKWSV